MQINEIRKDGYILDIAKEEVTNLLYTPGNHLADAETGKGKTHAFISISKELINKKENKDTIFVFSVPQVTQAIQNSKDFKIFGMYGEKGHNKILPGEQVLTATYDQSTKILKYVKDNNKNVILMIDEGHNKTYASNYRSKALKGLRELSEYATTVIDITATPNTLDISKYDKILRIKNNTRPNRAFKIIEAKDNKKASLVEFASIMTEKGKRLYIVLNNKNTITELKQVLEALNIRTGIVASDKDINDKNLEDSIVNNSHIPKEYKVVLTTSKLEAGVNILDDDIIPVIYADANTLIDTNLIQAPNRIRKAKEVIMFKMCSIIEEEEKSAFMTRDSLGSIITSEVKEQLLHFKTYLQATKTFCKGNISNVNELIKQSLVLESSTGPNNMGCIEYDEDKQELYINEDRLMLKIEQKYCRQFHHHRKEFKKEIEQTGEYLKVSIIQAGFDPGEKIKESLNSIKEEFAESEEKAINQVIEWLEQGELSEIEMILNETKFEYVMPNKIEEAFIKYLSKYKHLKELLSLLIKYKVQEQAMIEYLRKEKKDRNIKDLKLSFAYKYLNSQHPNIITERPPIRAKAQREYFIYRVFGDKHLKNKNAITEKTKKDIFELLKECKLIKEKELYQAYNKTLDKALFSIYHITNERVIKLR